MAISFGKSLKNERAAMMRSNTSKPVQVETSAISTYAADDNYTRSEKYKWYYQYSDDNYSRVDENKNIVVDSNQINITQENNSQYIPFQMARRYDGIDLMEMMLQIHYLNVDGQEAYATPVNVTYSEEYIRFAWLVSNYVTAQDGEIQFEITAVGVNEKGESYMWRTRPNGRLNILQALTGEKMVEPDTDWYTSFVALMDEKVSNAASYASAAQASAQDAANAAAGVDNKIQNAAITPRKLS